MTHKPEQSTQTPNDNPASIISDAGEFVNFLQFLSDTSVKIENARQEIQMATSQAQTDANQALLSVGASAGFATLSALFLAKFISSQQLAGDRQHT